MKSPLRRGASRDGHGLWAQPLAYVVLTSFDPRVVEALAEDLAS